MICPRCKEDDTQNREMCPNCGAPIRPIPVPPLGKIKFGKYDWFVLDKRDDKMLIITEKVIKKLPYHHEETEITWETCDMRTYLNNEFYHSFDKTDRKRIIEVINENPDNPWYGTRGGNPTNDRIFLLSIDEVIKYFGDSGQLKTRYMYPNCEWCKDEFLPWLDDEYNINRRAVDDEGIVYFWRLRSPGSNQCSVATVDGFVGDEFDHGAINIGNADLLVEGHFVQTGCGYLSKGIPGQQTMNGVRPALWLKTQE